MFAVGCLVAVGVMRKILAILSLALASGCAPQTHSILDAAGVFRTNQAVFSSIRATYPGPYDGFMRIPARDPADEKPRDTSFLQLVREDIPVAFLDFFPIEDADADEIDVVLWRELTNDRLTTTSLIYFSRDMTLDDAHEHMRVFDVCNQEVADWIDETKAEGPTAAFCKVSTRWYAYQRVE